MSKSQLLMVWVTVLLLGSRSVQGAHILGMFPTNTQSHYVMYGSLMREMAARGHQVTVVNHFPMKKPVKNFVDISLDGTLPALSNNISIDVPLSMSPIGNHLDTINDCLQSCEIGLNHPQVLALMEPEHKFDLFVTEIFGSECFLAMAHKLGIPAIGVVSSVNLPWVNDMVANPDNPAYVPLYFYPLTQWMNFYERLYNTIMTVVIKASYEVLANWPAQKLVEDALGPLPTISSMARNFSMILLNSHFSINQVRPWVPQIVEVGGLHIKKPGKLPEDIQTFLDESKDGVVYFSFGSMLKIESIPWEKLQQVISVLGRLKQRVLWKVDAAHLPKLPPNIKTGTWMPQLEVLCHPATTIFISHGGLLGSQEAITCGVPILGVPLFADQALNLAELQRRGVAEVINYYDVNEKTFTNGLEKLLNDSSYSEKMKHLSQLFTDRPQHPMDTAIYWLEYVIKYKGARHLRSAALDLAWYQYLLLDIISFMLVSFLIAIFLLKYILKKIINMFSAEEKTKEVHQNSINNNITYAQNGYLKTNGYGIKLYQNGVTKPYQNGVLLYQNGLAKSQQNGDVKSLQNDEVIHKNGEVSPRQNGDVKQHMNGEIKPYQNGELKSFQNGGSQTRENKGTYLFKNNIGKIIDSIKQFWETGHPKRE